MSTYYIAIQGIKATSTHFRIDFKLIQEEVLLLLDS